MLRYLFILLLSALSLSSEARTPAEFIEASDALFGKYVSNGRVDYAGLKSSGELAPLITDIAEIKLSTLKGNQLKAHLINSYNLLVIQQAIDHYPLTSVLDVPGFFDENTFNVGGRELTLNQLEKDVLFKAFPDARLHFALVCGAVGCPPIIDAAYRAATLDAQLERQTKRAVNNARFLRVEGDKVALSKIFEWYADDFGGGQAAIVDWINRYRKEALPEGAEVSYYAYDWKLNG